ncbi:hypothetical protein [Persicitalea jodogahamensis]|uniref:Uncharacterized protein n=1 Tax=Persicitalea jodogahamensis TaxID=402147 RepID=A0A8J3D2P4_9BACT|nr:hypothetical protein [Persicitalea jodogahamensis]GHB62181.1 hypothetical protein GCM10007390_14920 [Persicitalea jodogahamensis]
MKTVYTFIKFLIVILSLSPAFAQVQVGAWQIHEGNEGIIEFNTPDMEARIAAFDQAKIPAKSDTKWELAKTQSDGTVDYPDLGRNVKKCAQQLDFTYFQTSVFIPKNVDLKTFTVSYDMADDGARIYFFNSNHKNGGYQPGSDLIGNASKYKEVDLKDQLVKGEENRIVIVQYNQCTNNSIRGVRIKVNSKEVAPAVLPIKFRLHAYSISGNRVETGSDYWMGYDKNAQKKNAGDGNKPYFEGKIVSPKDATVMEFEKIDVDKAKGIIALKLLNSPIPDLYLQVGNDKLLTLYPGTPASGRGHFYVRTPEEKEAGGLNYISLETAGYPANGGWFLRHQGYVLKVTQADANARNDKVYRQDASWLFEPVK